MNTNMFDGSEKVKIKTLTVPSQKKPTEVKAKTTEDEDVCKFVKDDKKPFQIKDGIVGGNEVKGISKPKESGCCEESSSLTFDRIYSQIMESEDGLGLDTQSSDMNLDGDGFNDETGDLNDDDLDDDSIDIDNDDPEEDDIEEDSNVEDIANLKLAIKYLKKMVKKMGGDVDDDDDEDDEELDDLEVPEEDETLNGDDGQLNGQPPQAQNQNPQNNNQPSQQPQLQTQQESVQMGIKSQYGPKMSQRANGKLGKKKAKGFNWTGKKYDVSGQAKKMAKSKFGPKMGRVVSKISKGDFLE